MKGKGKEIDIDALILKYRWWIGSILLIAIIASGGYLLWRERGANNEARLTNDEQISQMEERIKDSELRIQQLETKISETPNNVEAMKQPGNDDRGKAAGTSTSVFPSSNTTIVPVGKVNLNTASVSQLDTLPGIGAAYAQRIIDYRTSHGGFKNISELKNIKGIGDKTYDKLKDLVTI